MSVPRHKQNLADIRHRERWGPRLREFKKGSVIRREGRLDVNKGESPCTRRRRGRLLE